MHNVTVISFQALRGTELLNIIWIGFFLAAAVTALYQIVYPRQARSAERDNGRDLCDVRDRL